MRIVCPSCAAAYDVADNVLPVSGRVRCARCATEWQVDPPIAKAMPILPQPESETEPAHAAPTQMRAAPEPRVDVQPLPPRKWPMPQSPPDWRENRAVGAAWVISLLALVALAVAAYVFQTDILRAWPPSERLYQLFGR